MNWLFCGVIVMLGWGLRGEIGGPAGAAVPGCMLGLAVAVASGRTDWLRKAPLFAAAGALGMALGGMQSYGRIIGFTRGYWFGDVAFGFAMLGVIGGLWGAFGAGAIGMVASRKPCPWWQVLAFVPVAAGAGWLAGRLLVDVAGLSMNNDPSRGESWAVVAGACLAMLAFFALRRDALPARLMFWGAFAGAAGFMTGELFQILGSHLGPPFDWWKVMEQSFGFILGAGIAYGVRRECADLPEAPLPAYGYRVFGVVVALWLVPVLVVADMVEHFMGGDTPVMFPQESFVPQPAQYALRAAVLLAVLLIAAAQVRRRGVPLATPEYGAKALLLWSIWVPTLLCLFKMSVPTLGVGHFRVHLGFLLWATLASVWVITRLEPGAGWSAVKPRLTRWAVAFAALFALMAAGYAALGLASHPGPWPGGAHSRFGETPAPGALKAPAE